MFKLKIAEFVTNHEFWQHCVLRFPHSTYRQWGKLATADKCFSSVSTSSCTSTNSHTSKQGQKWWWNNKTQTLFNLYLFIITKGFLQNTWHKLTLLLKYGPYMELFLFQILISMIEFKFYLWKYALKKVIHFVEIQLEVEIEEKRLSAVASFPHCPIVLWPYMKRFSTT